MESWLEAHTAALPHGKKKKNEENVTNAEGINLQGETSVWEKAKDKQPLKDEFNLQLNNPPVCQRDDPNWIIKFHFCIPAKTWEGEWPLHPPFCSVCF